MRMMLLSTLAISNNNPADTTDIDFVCDPPVRVVMSTFVVVVSITVLVLVHCIRRAQSICMYAVLGVLQYI